MKTPRRATTLVELVVVTAVLGILAAVVTARFAGARDRAAAVAVLTDVEAIFRAAEVCRARTGALPGNALRGEWPSDFDGLLTAQIIGETTPIGGDYDWEGPGTGQNYFGVTIHFGDTDLFAEVDRLGDDGSMATGWITGDSSYLRFELAPSS